MNNRHIGILVKFMLIALILIVFVQFVWVLKSLEIAKQQFANNVNRALEQVVDWVNEGEQTIYLYNGFVDDEDSTLFEFSNFEHFRKLDSLEKELHLKEEEIRKRIDDEHENIEEFEITSFIPDEPSDENIVFSFDEKDNVIEINSNDGSTVNIEIQDDDKITIIKNVKRFGDKEITKIDTIDKAEILEEKKKFLVDTMNYFFEADSLVVHYKQFEKVIEKAEKESKIAAFDVESRLDKLPLNKYIRKALAQNNVKLDFEQLAIESEHDFDKKELPYSINLFPHDYIQKDVKLVLFFSNEQSFLLKSIWLQLVLSLLAILFIGTVFYYSARMLYRQKKLSDMKNDFINNITHEFKTPIATISVASSSLSNKKVLQDVNRIAYFNNAIRLENEKMNKHVESILQIAAMERSDFDLDFQEVSINELLEACRSHFELIVAESDVDFGIKMLSEDITIKADEVHLLNALNNLVDNALKYNEAPVEVKLYAEIRDSKIILGVKDNGIGLSKEQRKQVFDRFYRVTHGNIHKVKGFGLGLSYVQSIVDKHGAQISLESKIGEGTCFEISLPTKSTTL